MSDIFFPVHMENCFCGKCGIVWMIPAMWMRTCQLEGKSIYCPSGHRGSVPKLKKPRELDPVAIQAIHDREQREARERDARSAKRNKRKGEPPAD